MSVYDAGQQFAAISANSSGSNTLVAAVSGKAIKVISLTFIVATAETVLFKSGTAVNLSGSMAFGANSGMVGAYSPTGLFKTAAGSALTVNLTTGGTNMAGFLTYVLA